MDTLSATRTGQSFDAILTDFDLLGDWEDRYRYVIELGRGLAPLPEAERTPATKVQGCVSQVWLTTRVDSGSGMPRLSFVGDSDAHIVRGLIAILFALYSGKTAKEISTILDISTRTVEFHKYEMMQSAGIHTSAELVHFAIKHGLVEI